MTSNPIIAGIEIGGTKCICVLGDGGGRIMERQRVETSEPDTTLPQIDLLLDRWQRDHRFDGIGIASFGPVDLDAESPTYGSIVSTPKPQWSGTPLIARWRKHGVPIGFDIDVIGAARAEQRWGAAQGLADFAYITVGTGLGVGPIIGGRAIRGRGHCEMGHMRIPRLVGDEWPGICPYHGDCIEGLACGPAIETRHGPGAILDSWDGWLTVEHALALLVHNLFVGTQPQRILLGGGVIERRPWLIGAIRKRAIDSLAGYYTAAALQDDFLVAPGLGADAGPLGALAVGLQAIAQ